MMNRTLLLAATCLVMAACAREDASPLEDPAASAANATDQLGPSGALEPASAIARLESKSGSEATGELELSAVDGGVSITGELAGLTAGSEHAFHVHEMGDCSAPDASSAGGHFNPAGAPHGPPTVAPDERHLGDMPNVVADTNGASAVTASVRGATLRDGGPNDLIGKAVVVHEKRDDYMTQPSGDAGGRIACGVIR